MSDQNHRENQGLGSRSSVGQSIGFLSLRNTTTQIEVGGIPQEVEGGGPRQGDGPGGVVVELQPPPVAPKGKRRGRPRNTLTRAERLLRIDGLRLFTGPMSGYVYFLCAHNNAVTYVGQTFDIATRIAAHRKERIKPFSRVFALPVDRNHLDGTEGIFIRIFDPPHNRQQPQWGRANLDYVATAFFKGDLAFLLHLLETLPEKSPSHTPTAILGATRQQCTGNILGGTVAIDMGYRPQRDPDEVIDFCGALSPSLPTPGAPAVPAPATEGGAAHV